MNKAVIFNIMHYSIHDGPGIRTTVFFKGCPLSCKWCHNPEGIAFEPGEIFYKNRCINCGNCEKGCPTGARETVGYHVTAEQLMKEIKKDSIFYDQSGGGVTFSGGEPLGQPEFLLEMLKRCEDEYIHTVVDTSGCTNEQTIIKIAEHTKIFLYDLKFFNEDRHLEYCGVSNKNILRNLETLSRMQANIYVRIPVIPGVNDDINEMTRICDFIGDLHVLQVNLLPYHNIHSEKYTRLGKEYQLGHISTENSENLLQIKELFSAKNIKVKIGG